ncbi:bleomycin resistance protein [Burkholderia ubonensis]|uniref:Bleomycin resistance protein n=1 Tax=Burkholderia ubonensis TaxID=101571 RepID=A0AB74D1Z9_9BURK|nr:VOC family protein [Burkholderia ubonensis]PAJ80773.1 aldoketomutase [Burkholderia ubonensis]PAK01187.1 aldoketomutase [Burkholderia ubonensis]RQP28350.1 VOC family protein [Burkholderia ubonensis]RQP36155.1 VOC family protein [Burkholderia ubonensis]RQP38976.1 VOC family protein [Burkholderia ubonensis]
MEWAALVPELICSDLAGSVRFYRDVLGFRIRFERPEDGFAYLEIGRAQLMLEQHSPESWLTGPMEPPFGRGINLQIEVDSIGPIHDRILGAGVALFVEPRTSWYRQDDIEHGQIEMLVQDPDGYLLRLVEILPERPWHG